MGWWIVARELAGGGEIAWGEGWWWWVVAGGEDLQVERERESHDQERGLWRVWLMSLADESAARAFESHQADPASPDVPGPCGHRAPLEPLGAMRLRRRSHGRPGLEERGGHDPGCEQAHMHIQALNRAGESRG